MVTEREDMTPFQAFLVDKFLEYQNQKKRPVSDNEFARYLHVNAGSWNQWINGSRSPDFYNALKMSEKLGPEVFDLLGFPRVITSKSAELWHIVEVWDQLDTVTQKNIYDQVKEKIEKM
jgi:hypothetical protein